MPDIEKIANILGADTVKKIYEDGASKSVQESGKMLTDLIKAARLFTAPIQLLATYQDRLEKHFDRIRNSIPKENQIEAPAHISGLVIERLKFLEDNNYLADLYVTLLSKAANKEKINQAHPAFVHIIDQLSPDEALLLYYLKTEQILIKDATLEEGVKIIFFNKNNVRHGEMKLLNFPENYKMYISHMYNLSLISASGTFNRVTNSEVYKEFAFSGGTYIELTDFGKLFVKACIPEDGYSFMGNNT